MWTKTLEVIKLVEVEKAEPLPPLDKELAGQVVSLQYHPGFVYLLRKLRLQRSLLRNTLETQRQATLTDSEFLKSGIAWTSWLDDQLAGAVNFQKRQSAPREILEEEQAAFDQVAANLELVGS